MSQDNIAGLQTGQINSNTKGSLVLANDHEAPLIADRDKNEGDYAGQGLASAPVAYQPPASAAPSES